MDTPAPQPLATQLNVTTSGEFVVAAPPRDRPASILIGKAGLDGHDRGAKYVVRLLRDAGYRVIYSGIRRTPDELVKLAMDEHVDAIGLSILSGAHELLFQRLKTALHAAGLGQVVLFAGGIIPDPDVRRLKQLGVAEVFTPGSSAQQILQGVGRFVPLPTVRQAT